MLFISLGIVTMQQISSSDFNRRMLRLLQKLKFLSIKLGVFARQQITSSNLNRYYLAYVKTSIFFN